MDSYFLHQILCLALGEPNVDSREVLGEAIEAVGENPTDEAVVSALIEQIRALEARPELVTSDLHLSNELLRARLMLAWARFDDSRPLEDQPEVSEAIDEVIRTAAGRALPLAADFEPGFKQAVRLRAAALQEGGQGTIQADCERCELIVNELRHPNPTYELPLGHYRVWVLGEGAEMRLHQTLVLEHSGQRVVVVPDPPLFLPRSNPSGRESPFLPILPTLPENGPREPAASPADRDQRSDDGGRPSAARARLLPVWGESLGIVVGVGAMATGAGLLAVDGQCEDGGDVDTCPIYFENTSQGIGLAAAGAGVLIAFTAVLIVDQVRILRSERSARVALDSGVLRF